MTDNLKTQFLKTIRFCRFTGLLVYGSSLLAFTGSILASEEPPAWLRQAALTHSPSFDKKIPAVVLFDEQKVTVDENGHVVTENYYAIRLLSRDGRDAAVARQVYRTDTRKVRDLRAWLIPPSGPAIKYGKDRILDVSLVGNDVYNEVRTKLIAAGNDADVGAVFGFESKSEDQSIFTQFEWHFQGRLPTLLSRFVLTLPKGWRFETFCFNHANIEPTINGSIYSWELRDLPFIEEEPASPDVASLAPRLAISYFPAASQQSSTGPTFKNWADVSVWLSEVTEPQTTLNDALIAKANDLCAGAKTELERIRAVARYVQSVNYVSIQIGLARGGGYRPHAAADVFAKSYGDCKDKATLMRALLKALKIPSFLVIIYSGDPTYVKEEWASPQQFNHCIIAVKVNDETEAVTVIRHPTLGRLLIFDPTDEYSVVGDLPDHEQNSLALIVARDEGSLMRMPTSPPETNHLERETDVVLAPNGSMTACVRERSQGRSAGTARHELQRRNRPEYLKMIEAWIARDVTGAKILKIQPVDNNTEGRFQLEVEFSTPSYAQLMQDRLLVFKPVIVSRLNSLSLTEPSRKSPVVLDSSSFAETVKVKLPAGFEIDELPDAINLDKSFGAYFTRYQLKNGDLLFTRSLTLRAMVIPVEEYATVRSFFEQIRMAEQTPVVLARK